MSFLHNFGEMKRAKTIGLPVITMATKIDTLLAFKSGCFLAAHELSVKNI